MICTVTLNPSLDYIVSVENFCAGEINRADGEKILPGGKGINVSIVLKRLGYETTALGFIAGFSGREIERLLEEAGVRTDFIPVRGNSRINVKLRAQQETQINGRGPRIQKEDIEQLFGKLDSLTDGDVLVLSGSIPPGVSESVYRKIMDRLKGRGVLITADAEGDLLKQVLPCRPFLIKPNHQELAQLFDTEISDQDTALFYAQKLRDSGARNVLVSMGDKGAVFKGENGEEYRAVCLKGQVKNSVGAGDSMVAGFLAGYLRNRSFRDAFRLGVCAGSASAFSEGLAEERDIRSLLEESEGCFLEQ